MNKIIIVVLILAVGIMIYTNRKEEGYQKISPSEVKAQLDSNENIVILDVRTKQEYKEGHIPKSILVPVGEISKRIENVVSDKDKKIVVYCRSGNRSKVAANNLLKMGYKNVYDLGGINKWPYEIQ